LNTADRLPGLDLLRSIAILWVMLFHSFLLGGLGPTWSWLSRFGWMGVDLFFVLSGFLIGGQVFASIASDRKFSFGDFYVRRAFRILPAYFAVLLLYALWPAFSEAPGMEPLWKFLTFTMNLSIDYGRNSGFSHAWSLCVEEHFYWLFPVLAVALLKRPATWKFGLLCAVVVLGGIALRAVIWTHGMETDPDMAARNWFVEDIYYPTWNRLDGLLCGVALAAWKTFRPQAWLTARRYANLSLVSGVLVMALSFWLFRDRTGLLGNTIGWPVLSIGLGLLVFAAADRDSLIGRAQVPLASWLAAISYSLYLMHKATYHVVQAHWGAQLAGTGLLAFSVYGGTAILAGAALHYVIERPFLKLRVRLATARRNQIVSHPT
jgi:peptidoglycan/LPS O-acetylase OafA/YrhL